MNFNNLYTRMKWPVFFIIAAFARADRDTAIAILATYKPNFPIWESYLTDVVASEGGATLCEGVQPSGCDNATAAEIMLDWVCSLNRTTDEVPSHDCLFEEILHDVERLSRIEPTVVIHYAWIYQLSPNNTLHNVVRAYFRAKKLFFESIKTQVVTTGRCRDEVVPIGSEVLRYTIERLLDQVIIRRPKLALNFKLAREESILSTPLIPSLHVTASVVISGICSIVLYILKALANNQQRLVVVTAARQ